MFGRFGGGFCGGRCLRALYGTKIDMMLMKQLRERTRAGIKDCIDALKLSENNIEKAMDYLRLRAKDVVQRKSDRNTTEGIVAAVTDRLNTRVSVVELLCETDFASRGTFFVENAIKLAQKALVLSPRSPKDFIENESIRTQIENLVYTLKENVQIRRVIHEESDVIGLYAYKKPRFTSGINLDENGRVLVGNKLGIVPLSFRPSTRDPEVLEVSQQLADQLAVHVVCMRPIYLKKEGLGSEVDDGKILMEQEFALSEDPIKVGQMINNRWAQFQKYHIDLILEKFHYVHYAEEI